ncbi:MAG: SEL1-like repeat protein, partial [Alphaproteobacteria bacterium]|nr:SEL1-like repeat protein [Alphaproteobacteria bacterium]
QINLANSYHRGRGVEQNDEKALEWYAKVFEYLHTQDPLSLWVVDRAGRTSSYNGVDDKVVAVPRLESKGFTKQPGVDPALRPLSKFNR